MDLDLSVLESLRIPAGPNRPAQPIARSLPQEPEPQPQVLSRSERSRLNGEKSKGPITPKGLENSSRNSLKHGLTATKHSVLNIEDNTEFEAVRQALIDEFRPKTLFTLRLVQQLAQIDWRKGRLTIIETAYLNHQLADSTGLDPLTQAAEGTCELAALAQSWIASAGPSTSPLDLLRRYLSTLQHQFNTTLGNLLKLEKRADHCRHDPNFHEPYQQPTFPEPQPETKRTQESAEPQPAQPAEPVKTGTNNRSAQKLPSPTPKDTSH